jgi:hypothetical protein
MFVDRDGQVLVNEIAPRPHNSGHWTMDACPVDQFAMHVRAVTGSARVAARRPASDAAMKNLIGPDDMALWPAILATRPAAASLRQARSAARPQDGPRQRPVPRRRIARRIPESTPPWGRWPKAGWPAGRPHRLKLPPVGNPQSPLRFGVDSQGFIFRCRVDRLIPNCRAAALTLPRAEGRSTTAFRHAKAITPLGPRSSIRQNASSPPSSSPISRRGMGGTNHPALGIQRQQRGRRSIIRPHGHDHVPAIQV